MTLLQATELLAFDDLVLDYQYKTIFQISVFALALLTVFQYSFSNDRIINHTKSSNDVFSFFIALLLIIFIGWRTYFGVYIQDTRSYDWGWKLISNENSFGDISKEGDWLFQFLQLFFFKIGASFEMFMTFVAFIYIAPIFIIAKKLLNSQYWLFLIFCITTFSFFSGAVNGIRNAMASRIVMLALCFISCKRNRDYLIAIILFMIAIPIHHSVAVTITCALISTLFIRDTKIGMAIWLLAIPVGFFLSGTGDVLGEWLKENTDETRLIDYSSLEDTSFSGDGFRWDFLLYSSMPVLMSWYVTIKRNFKDSAYNIIANTYMLTNAVWIILIRIPYNNRVANLSWILYPLVIGYPLLRFNIWKNQDRKLAFILFVYASFTFVMYLLGK